MQGLFCLRLVYKKERGVYTRAYVSIRLVRRELVESQGERVPLYAAKVRYR
nr:MAG TPA: hypothetical protein [Caudoviricetes sp.]